MIENQPDIEPEILMVNDLERTPSWGRTERERDIRQGFDLATTLERIEKNFVITDPRLPDNPIVRKIIRYKCCLNLIFILFSLFEHIDSICMDHMNHSRLLFSISLYFCIALIHLHFFSFFNE